MARMPNSRRPDPAAHAQVQQDRGAEVWCTKRPVHGRATLIIQSGPGAGQRTCALRALSAASCALGLTVSSPGTPARWIWESAARRRGGRSACAGEMPRARRPAPVSAPCRAWVRCSCPVPPACSTARWRRLSVPKSSSSSIQSTDPSGHLGLCKQGRIPEGELGSRSRKSARSGRPRVCLSA